MSRLTFAPPNDPVLKMRSAEVPVDQIGSKEIQGLIDEMLMIAKGERSDLLKRVMVGLAAPQVGVPIRVVIVDIGVDSSRQNLGTLRPISIPSSCGNLMRLKRGEKDVIPQDICMRSFSAL